MWIKSICDMHVHLREGKLLEDVIDDSTKYCDYVVAMPNLKKPIRDIQDLLNYKSEVESTQKNKCNILYTIYLTPTLTFHLNKLKEWKKLGLFAIKLYTKCKTTNSESGLSNEDLESNWLKEILSTMHEADIPLLCHGENPDSNCIDAESQFHYHVLNFKEHINKIVLEHITTMESVIFVQQNNLGATITPHHLILTIDDVVGQPNNYCKPVAKFETDRETLINVIKNGDEKFFLGSDSAPHRVDDKFKMLSRCCAGCYHPNLIELLLTIFDQNNMMTKFENFTRNNAIKFYDLPNIDHSLIEVRHELKSFVIPDMIKDIMPFMAGQRLDWSIITQEVNN